MLYLDALVVVEQGPVGKAMLACARASRFERKGMAQQPTEAEGLIRRGLIKY